MLSDILNKVSCGASGLLGNGGKFCPIDIDTPKLIILSEKGLKVAPGDTFDLAYIQTKQQEGKMHVFKGVVNFTDNTPENELGTYDATGEKYLTMKAPYELTFMFDRGLYSYKALVKYESNGQHDIWIFDVKNDLFMAKDQLGNGRGLNAGLVTIGKYGIGKENSQSMTVQINRADFDNNVAWISNEELDFTAEQDLDGWNDVEITMTAPANLATTVAFTVKAVSNNKLVPLEGLLVGDLLYQVDGVTVVPSALTAGTNPGEYTITVAALATAEVLTLRLYDTATKLIVNLDGVLYKSNIATTTVL